MTGRSPCHSLPHFYEKVYQGFCYKSSLLRILGVGEVMSICLKVSFLVVRLLSALSSLGVALVVFVTGLPDRTCLAWVGKDDIVAGGLHLT